jgi:6-phosphofructokinase
MHLGILTGGGDVPGLNSAIKAVVNEAASRGWRVTGFRRGWSGPLRCNPKSPEESRAHILPLSPSDVRAIDRTGGTLLHTSRTQPSKVSYVDLPEFLKRQNVPTGEPVDCTAHVLSVLEALQIDVLIAIGGDDTLSYAARLHNEGAAVICIPKTMDNDVFGTEYCIGFSTCVSRSVELINRLRTPAGSHERFLVVEMFGRNSGQTALTAGYLTDAHRTLIAEVPVDMEKLARLLSDDRKLNPSRYAIAVVSEGASLKGGPILETGERDAFGHRKLGGIGIVIGAHLQRLTGVAIMNQSLGYLLRAGPPDVVDLMVARNFGTMAVRLIEDGKTGLMVAIQDGKYTSVSADIHTKGKRSVDVPAMYDPETYRPIIAKLPGLPLFPA